MATTYTNDIEHNELDWVRFTIGDTNVNAAFLTDEEIQGCLALTSTRHAGAKMCMERILIMLSQKPDYKIGSTSVTYSDVFTAYKARYDSFAKNGKFTCSGIPEGILGGIFSVGMMDGGN